MSKKTEKIHVLSDSEKVEFLSHLEGKGEAVGEGWQLIHSELCHENESDIDLNEMLRSLDSQKFAIRVESNPNEDSFLDAGNVKVRYRYVLDPANAGEAKIKENTREFCETLIRKDLLYRREDINIMSFRGANPVASQNYSIFKLQGHWNCRHAWQREIYVTSDKAKKVQNGNLIDKDIAMSIKTKFGKFLTDLGVKLTQEDIVDLNKIMLADKGVDSKFVDIDVDGKKLRVDGDKLEAGVAVSWVDEEGNLTEVPNGKLPVEIDGKKFILVIEDRKIKEVTDVEKAEGSDDAEEQMSAAEGKTLRESVDSLKTELPTMIAEAIKTNLSSVVKDEFVKVNKDIEEKFKSIPAFKEDKISVSLSKEGTETKEGTMLERMTQTGSKTA